MVIKPNLLTRPREGVTTNPGLIARVVEVLRERTDDVAVVETDSTERRLEPNDAGWCFPYLADI